MFRKKQASPDTPPIQPSDPPAVSSSPARGGRRRSADTAANLRADAVAASEILASYSEMWSAEQVLLHPELARLVVVEARTDLASRAGQPGADHESAVVENAIALLAEAQRDVIVVEK